MKTFTPEMRAKAKQTKLVKKSQRAASGLHIGPYSIVKVDEYNWQITGPKLRKDGNYYYRLEHALKALPALLLDQEAKNSVATLLHAQKACREMVEEALKQANRMNLLR